jgi:hypothetical protein
VVAGPAVILVVDLDGLRVLLADGDLSHGLGFLLVANGPDSARRVTPGPRRSRRIAHARTLRVGRSRSRLWIPSGRLRPPTRRGVFCGVMCAKRAPISAGR